MTDPISVTVVAEGVARLAWTPGHTLDEVRSEVASALTQHSRVETLVASGDQTAQRTATWAGMHKEGVMRMVGADGQPQDRIVYARLVTDMPLHEAGGFRSLLNSFLPRKRAISQLLIRDPDDRVLMCRLTYKKDWDLPGGVVEVGESPQLAVSREVHEELDLVVPAGRLLLADWLPPWGGWDDALCLVFDGGVLDASVLDSVVRQEREIAGVQFCTPSEVREHAADFTARRVEAALAAVAEGTRYTESGR